MQYLHVKNLDKYHPGYKDRDLKWCKAYFSMINSDPEFEMLCEIDKSRYLTFIMLELQMKKPVPLDPEYLSRKGLNLKKRNLTLTLDMLQKHLVVVTEKETPCNLDKDKEEDKDKEKEVVTVVKFKFKDIASKYPNKDGSKLAEKYFNTSVKNETDWNNINFALENYLQSDKPKAGYVKNCSTWFNNWRDWVPDKPKKPMTQADHNRIMGVK